MQFRRASLSPRDFRFRLALKPRFPVTFFRFFRALITCWLWGNVSHMNWHERDYKKCPKNWLILPLPTCRFLTLVHVLIGCYLIAPALKQVTRGHNIVADGWAGAANPHPHPTPNPPPNSPSNTDIHKKLLKRSFSNFWTSWHARTNGRTDGQMDGQSLL